MIIDISNLAQQNHRYAIHLATKQNIITYHNGIYNIAKVAEYSPFETVDFWRNISLAVEILLKACLLKHHIPFFKKRSNGRYGKKVTAKNNEWLNNVLEQRKIKYIAEINTGTIGTTLKYAKNDLFNKIPIDPKKAQMLRQIIYIIIRTRRNRNSHFFFANQGQIDVAEVEMLFLPLLNQLEEIYALDSK